MKKKRIVAVIVFTLVCVFLAVVISLGWTFYIMKKDAPKLSKNEISLVLKQNKAKFENAVKTFDKYPSITRADNRDCSDPNYNLFYSSTKNNVYIESKKKLQSDVVKEIEQSDISFILKKLEFIHITNEKEGIYFTEGSDLAIAQGLVYTPDGRKPANMYTIELDRVDDNWYFFKER